MTGTASTVTCWWKVEPAVRTTPAAPLAARLHQHQRWPRCWRRRLLRKQMARLCSIRSWHRVTLRITPCLRMGIHCCLTCIHQHTQQSTHIDTPRILLSY